MGRGEGSGWPGHSDELLQIVHCVVEQPRTHRRGGGDKTLETFGTGTNAVSCENTEI